MASIEDKISSILSDPDAVSKLQSLSKALGLSGTDTSDDNNYQKPKPESACRSTDKFTGDVMSSFMRLAPLLSDMNKEDDVSRLLCALRPFLSSERCRRVDNAEKMLKVLRLLPIIRNTGFL